jgi:peptide/nickel transport system permease protein
MRNRLAVAALAVIGLYALVALAIVVCDAPGRGLTYQVAEEVVGPLATRGWFETQKPEKRVEDCKFYIDEFRKALRQQDKALALANLKFGDRRVADRPPEEIKAGLDRARELYDEVATSENLDKDPAMLPAIQRLEGAVDELFAPLHGLDRWKQAARTSLGTDRQGRSILVRAVYSIKVAIEIGIIVSVISVLAGSVIGAAAAFFGGWVDHFVVWLYSTLSSVPDLVLLAVLVYMFTGSVFEQASRPFLALVPVFAAMCLTFWIGPCRIVRGEAMKLKELEYVQAATAIGFSKRYILIRHILPNTFHLMFINFSLLFIAAVKFEVVLSFLGLGVKVGPSWGRMIQESTQEVINGFFWQIGTATVFMFFLVLAFNIFSDALQDAFDPKHVG